MVGGAGLDHRGGDERRHVSRGHRRRASRRAATFYGQLVIGTILARVVIAYTFIKPYYDYRVQSVYEFLTVRFGTKTKNMASGIFLVHSRAWASASDFISGARSWS